MTVNQRDDFEDEKPLDPVLEKVRKKMLRLLFVSIGIMVAGVMAVLVAIVYKTNKISDDAKPMANSLSVPTGITLTATLALPDGFRVTSTSLSESRMMFFGFEPDGTQKALIFDIASAALIAEFRIAGE